MIHAVAIICGANSQAANSDIALHHLTLSAQYQYNNRVSLQPVSCCQFLYELGVSLHWLSLVMVFSSLWLLLKIPSLNQLSFCLAFAFCETGAGG